MKKIIFLVLSLALIGGAGAFLFMRESNENEATNSESSNITSEQTQTTQQLKEITLNDVAEHNTKSDCWTIINDKVYDITSYIPRHPGSDNILSACGTDGTAFFNGEMAGKLGGRENHRNDSRANSELAKLQIGVLTK